MALNAEPARGVELAGWRLERALSRLEARLVERLRRAEAEAGDLAASRARVRELEIAGAAAAAALDRAITQIREILAREASRG